MSARRGLLLVVLALALVLPQAAFGAVRCVPATGPGCDASHATITAAVTAASNDDTIRIAAGSYAESISTIKRLNFVGAGAGTLASEAGATVIRPGSGGALSLMRGGSARSLRLIGSSGLSAGSTALTLQPDADGSFTYTLTDVIGIGGSAADIVFGFPGSGLVTASATPARIVSLSISGSTFQAGGSVGFIHGIGASFGGAGLTAALTNTSVIGASDGGSALSVGSEAVLDATGLIAQGQVGAEVSDSTVTFRRSRIEGVSGTASARTGLAVFDFAAATPTSISVIDSLVTVTPSLPVDATALSATTLVSASPATVSVRGSTILARGNDPQYAVLARPNSGAPSATIALTNTIARLEGGAEADEADLAADRGTVTAAYSDFATRRQLNAGTVTEPGSGTNLIADPLFDTGAFTLQSRSPLIDRGDATAVTAGELDLAGNPRLAGLAPDIGAYELQPPVVPPPPPPANTPPSLSKVSMTNTVFAPVAARAARARKAVKHGTTFRYVLSEAATVSIVIERRASGRRAGNRCVKPTRKNAKRRFCTRWLRKGTLSSLEQAGRQSTAFSGRIGRRALAAGRYRARIRAKDGAGARSPERRLPFRVVRAR